ncbi:hypothetical protein [Cohnella abietis]|uniref:Uncharacterized protein n=1 Tax=Cohnella abietis TaxID=2507935 RepID=A0A3T1CZL3_9BACL|nr:hypothetical protein [Cohnella abietis]BBI31209.1 hypothetical protein KCTCHS21_06080 [Cohnella abietis]
MLTYRLSPKNSNMFLFIYLQQMIYIPCNTRGVTFICEAADEQLAASGRREKGFTAVEK